jgi:hypothetical protein
MSRTVYQPIPSIAFPATTHALLLEAYNLSEDMSTLSTHDDEVALFILSSDSIVFAGDTTFTSVPASLTRPLETTLHDSSIQFDVILFEIDSRRNPNDFIPIIKLEGQTLKQLFRTSDYQGIRKLLQEDDVLFYKQVSAAQLVKGVEISGAHKGDRYHYSVRLLTND